MMPPAINQFDGASLFAGNNFMPSQSTQAPDPTFSPAKSHGPQRLLPLTVKQITESCFASNDRSGLVVDGVEANFRVLGMVVDKVERVTDVSFLLDDGTGRIEINRWISVASDSAEVAAVGNGMYVQVNGHMKEFQGKRHAFAFSIRFFENSEEKKVDTLAVFEDGNRENIGPLMLHELNPEGFSPRTSDITCRQWPVIDYNDISLHFIECIYVHLENTRLKGVALTTIQMNPANGYQPPFSNAGYSANGYQPPISNQFPRYSGRDGLGNDVCTTVLGIFQEPSTFAREHGLHVDELFKRLGLPKNKIKDAINYLVDVGHIYSTIDEYHFKSASNGYQ